MITDPSSHIKNISSESENIIYPDEFNEKEINEKEINEEVNEKAVGEEEIINEKQEYYSNEIINNGNNIQQ